MIGIDEVGRGAWAGPLLVVAARGREELPDDTRDSKALSKSRRIALLDQLSDSCDFGEGWVAPVEIDEYGLGPALRLGVARCLDDLRASTDEAIIMDGSVNYCSEEYINAKCQVKADQIVPVVSAASIYAKVTRDRYMYDLAKRFPGYGFDRHVGYGTASHRDALIFLGALAAEHRMSFKPVIKYGQVAR